MGQPITVVETRSTSNPAVLRFETNRPLSGMGHERYAGPPSELLDRPVDELARRLFAAGGLETIHINGSVVTATLGAGQTGAGLGDIIRRLFLHYGDEAAEPMVAPTDEADTTPEALPDPADAPAAQAATDAAADPVDPDAEPPKEQTVEGIPEAAVVTDADAASSTSAGPAEPTES